MLSIRYTKIACYTGYFVQAIANNFLPLLFVILSDAFSIGYEKLGRLVLISFFTQLLTDILSIKVCDLVGYRAAVVCSHIFCVVGLGGLCFFPRVMPIYPALVLAVVIYSVGSGMIEVLVSPIVEYLPTENKSGNMAFLHSFYCFGSVVTVVLSSFLLHLFGNGSWGAVALIWSLLPLCNLFLFLRVPIIEPGKTRDKMTVSKLFSSPVFRLLAVLMLCAGASELAISDWISAFAERGLGLPKIYGDLAGPCLFAACMGVGRICFAFVGDKVSMANVLSLLSVVCFLCYLVLFFSSSAVLSLIACAVAGLCVSVMWPGVFSLASRAIPKGATALFGLLAMFGDGGCAGGPWLTGVVAEKSNLNMGFLAAAVFPLAMFLTAAIFKYRKGQKNNET